MNGNGTDSLISASFDGELAPEERAVAGRRLEESSALQDELAEVKQLSAWLKELPHEKLPAGFSQSVSQAIAQPAGRNNSSASRAVTLSPSGEAPRRFRWSQGIGTLIAAAAVLFVAVTLFNRPEQPSREPFGESAVVSSNESTFRETAAPQNAPAATGMPLAEEAIVDAAAVNAESPVRFYAENGTRRDRMTGDGAMSNATIAAGRESEGLQFTDNLEVAEVGQVVEALRQSQGGDVAVVRLTVVDRQVGLKNLQLLLTRNQIPQQGKLAEESVSRADEPIDEKLKAAPVASEDELIAVYVEATGAQLASVLKEIQHETDYQQLLVDRPISVSQLALAAAGSMRGGAGQFRNDRFARSEAAGGSQEPAPADRTRERRGSTKYDADKAKAEAERKLLDANEKKSADLNPKEGDDRRELAELDRTRQLRLSLSPEMLADSDGKKQTRDNRPPDDFEKKKRSIGRSAQPEPLPTAPRPAELQKDEPSAPTGRPAQAAVYVLFVLEKAPDAAENPPAKPAGESRKP